MSKRTTPIGFLPGDVELGSHGMFIYGDKGEPFVKAVCEYVSAGVNVGELCAVAIHGPVRQEIEKRLVGLGIELSDTPETGQVRMFDSCDLYLHNGFLDTRRAAQIWRGICEAGKERWNGLRAFGDVCPIPGGRTGWVKLLEYEALLNTDFVANVGLCAYQSHAVPRSYLLQAKNAHPFIANARSIRRNPTYQMPDRFLNSLYRFKRQSKVYPASPGHISSIRKDVESVATRTPMTMEEITGIQETIAQAFSNTISRCRKEADQDSQHVHATFISETDRLLVVLWYHRQNGKSGTATPRPTRENIVPVGAPLDQVHVGYMEDDVVVAMVKRYT